MVAARSMTLLRSGINLVENEKQNCVEFHSNLHGS